MASVPQQTHMTPKMKVPRPPRSWRRIFLAVLLLIFISAAIWTFNFYRFNAMPNVTVGSKAVGNMPLAGIENSVHQEAVKLRVTLKDKQKILEPELRDMGVTVDVAATVRLAFEARRGGDLLSDVQVWRASNIPLQLTVDETKLDEYLAAHFPETYLAPQQPDLEFNPGVEQFDVVPGKNGAGFDVAAINAAIQAVASKPAPLTISATDEPIAPSVTDAAAVYAQDEANKRLLLRLDFLYKDKLIYFPEASEVAAWMYFEPARDGLRLDIRYDTPKVVAFLRNNVTVSLNGFFGPGSATMSEKSEQLKIADPEALADDTSNALRSLESIEKEISVVTVGSSPDEVAP